MFSILISLNLLWYSHGEFIEQSKLLELVIISFIWRSQWMIQQYYCKEKFDADDSSDWLFRQGLTQTAVLCNHIFSTSKELWFGLSEKQEEGNLKHYICIYKYISKIHQIFFLMHNWSICSMWPNIPQLKLDNIREYHTHNPQNTY